MKSRGSRLNIFCHQFFMEDSIFGSLWLFAGFYVVFVAGPGGKVSPANLR